ncbi:class I adenylate-forming enzyme family protein [Prescottella sp. R16]|uniref:class I adenylate-forming enzyme family protein n=1 Tax=Prescottella sp. R16 TaxID=3064529 RepID=UPI00272E2B5A|nr:class I adenylate-forming enzyme family protein [Prescottella sp. R16]
MNILTLLEIAAGADGDRIAVGDKRDGLSYARLLELAGAFAADRADSTEQAVLYGSTASAAFPIALFGSAWSGIPFAPISYRLADEPMRRLIEGRAPAILVADGNVARVGADVAGVSIVAPDALIASLGGGDHGGAVDVAPAEQDPEAPAVLLHTSGTTGTPKVAILRHRHLVSYVLGGTELFSAGPDEAALVSVPPYHIAGVAGLLTGLYSGRRIVQMPNFDEREWVRLVREQDITHAMVVPTMLARIVDVLTEDGQGLPSLRHLSYGGGRMPLPVVERALELLPGVDFVNGYGLTETSSSIAVLGPRDHREALVSTDPVIKRRLGSVGQPVPDVEIVVCDDDGRPVPAGARGELWVRGAQVSGEYSGASLLDADGWFRTKDGGWIDDGGYVYVEGRLDDVIVRGGENLSPGEIEDVIGEHPHVDDVVVYGVPDDRWGEVVVAAIVPSGDSPDGVVTDTVIREWVGARLRSSRVPAFVEFRADLPRNDMGKVLRRVLREQFTAVTG